MAAGNESKGHGHNSGREMINVKWTKVTISGPPGSGKSSTFKLLLGEDPDPIHNSTPVVCTFLAKQSREELPWEKVSSIEKSTDSTDSGEGETAHFIYAVDTGGQAAFFDIAPAFLRYDSVNIITHKLNEKLEDKTSFIYSVEGKHFGSPIQRQLTNKQVFELSIRSLASVDPQEPELEGISFNIKRSQNKPNVIVLGTFRDLVENKDDIREKNKTLRKQLEKFKKDANIITKNIDTLSRKDKTIAKSIRKYICDSYLEATIPVCWFKFLHGLIDSNKSLKLMDIEDCYKAGESHDMNHADVQLALQFYHNLAILFYFHEILPNVVFLDPKLLFDELTDLIRVSFADGADYYEDSTDIQLPNEAHSDLKEKGLFKKDLLQAIGTCKLEEFLKLLESLNIVAKLPLDAKKLEDDRQYFLPCVLATTETTTEKILKLFSQYRRDADPLILRWQGKIIPQGLFCALVLYLLKEDDIDVIRFCDRPHRYRNAIQLPCKHWDGGILLIDSINYLEIHYSGSPAHCYKIQDMILGQLSKAVRDFHYNRDLSKPEKCFIHKCSCRCDENCPEGECKNECICVISRDIKRLTCISSDTTFDIDYIRQTPWLSKGSAISLLDKAPSLNELTKHIRVAHVLHELAIELCLPHDEVIKIFQQSNLVNKHKDVFQLWLETSTNPTRKHIVDALNSIKQNRLAKDYLTDVSRKDLENTAQEIQGNTFNVETVMKVLEQNNFYTHQWYELGEALGLSEDLLESIESKLASVSLKRCLTMWIIDEKGNPERTWTTLATALEFDSDNAVIFKYIREHCSK